MEYYGTNLREHGHFRWILKDDRLISTTFGFHDLPFNPDCLTNQLPKGKTVFYQGGGFTVLAISGSCKDVRHGTKSVFWVEDIIDKDDIINMIQASSMAAKIIKAMPFKVEW